MAWLIWERSKVQACSNSGHHWTARDGRMADKNCGPMYWARRRKERKRRRRKKIDGLMGATHKKLIGTALYGAHVYVFDFSSVLVVPPAQLAEIGVQFFRLVETADRSLHSAHHPARKDARTRKKFRQHIPALFRTWKTCVWIEKERKKKMQQKDEERCRNARSWLFEMNAKFPALLKTFFFNEWGEWQQHARENFLWAAQKNMVEGNL